MLHRNRYGNAGMCVKEAVKVGAAECVGNCRNSKQNKYKVIEHVIGFRNLFYF